METNFTFGEIMGAAVALTAMIAGIVSVVCIYILLLKGDKEAEERFNSHNADQEKKATT